MTTDNTQELDEILRHHLKRVYFNGSTDTVARQNGVIPNDTKLGEVQIEVELEQAKQAILDWHNKQIEAVLERLSNILTGSDDFRIEPGVSLDLTIGQIRAIRLVIEAERKKLKEGK